MGCYTVHVVNSSGPSIVLKNSNDSRCFNASNHRITLRCLSTHVKLHPLLHNVDHLLRRRAFSANKGLSHVGFRLSGVLRVLRKRHFNFSSSTLYTLLRGPGRSFRPMGSLQPSVRDFRRLCTRRTVLSSLRAMVGHVVLFGTSDVTHVFNGGLACPFVSLRLFRFLRRLPMKLGYENGDMLSVTQNHSISGCLLGRRCGPLLPRTVALGGGRNNFTPVPLFFHSETQHTFFGRFVLTSNVVSGCLHHSTIRGFLASCRRITRGRNN